jgi:hypothetical protein
MVSGASPPISSAHAMASSGVPMRCTQPAACAAAASTVAAVSSIDDAVAGPVSSARRCTVQWSTTRPSLAAGIPNRLRSVATRRSQAMASCVPAPSAGPSTAAMVTSGAVDNAASTAVSASWKPWSSTPVRSAPAQKALPSPRSTTTRLPAEAASSSAAFSATNMVWFTALRRSGRSSVMVVTVPVADDRITPGP